MGSRLLRRRRRYGGAVILLILLGGGAASTWWLYREERTAREFDAGKLVAEAPPKSLAVDPIPEPIKEPSTDQPKAAPKIEPAPTEEPPPNPSIPPSEPANPRPADSNATSPLLSGREALAKGDLVGARLALSQALAAQSDPREQATLRTELQRISADTILSPRIAGEDPLVERYVIRSGDVLAKIAATNRITSDLLASINGIANKHQIREGQGVKLIKGPFRAVVHKSSYRLDVFLGDVFVREFSVGLGADDSTPTGEWRVSTKLMNPTYYPPRGGEIVSADDPKNPLGERWIGLVGIGGAAVDQQRYGIHGTNEPDSIGRSLSMGCVRLRNEDVEILYDYLVETHSTVTVVE